MNGKFLLDTNIVIALFRKDKSVLSQLRIADEVFIPIIVLGELYYGARKSVHTEENVERIRDLANSAMVIGIDGNIAEMYGTVKDMLRASGKPIPENDIWIAAVAKEYGLTVVSRDEHFREIEDLHVEEW